MITPATLQKRQELASFIERVLVPEPTVQGVVGIGSIATGRARPDSDIDACLFLDPYDAYIVPAEFKWRPSDGSYTSIFEHVPAEDCLQLDFERLDLSCWADPATEWPEERRAELAAGWLAYDRSGRVAELVQARTRYTDEARIARLDEALLWLDQHLSGHRPQRTWQTLGPVIAHDRLQAAYGYLVQALFAYNRRWRPWRNRQASALLALPWLPEPFAERVLAASNAPSLDRTGYLARAEALRGLSDDLVARLVADGLYGEDPAAEAFFRSHDEPGWAHNMDQWKAGHRERAE